MSGSFQKGGCDSVVVRMLWISDVTLLVFDAVVSLYSSLIFPLSFFLSQDNETLYLVAMLDPDTPSFRNPHCRHWVHFIFGNVKVSLIPYKKTKP